MIKLDLKPIEIDFPIEQLNEIAEREAHAKEKYRPILYIHKWWARRLGSVFRTIILYSLVDENTKVFDEDIGKWRKISKEELENPWNLYLKDVDFGGKIVLDPMMGGGTTVVEALRTGCKVVAQDLNPVAWFLVKKIVEPVDINELKEAIKGVESTVSMVKSDMEDKTQMLREAENKISEMEKILSEKDQLLAQKDNQLVEKDNQIKSLQDQLAQVQPQIAEKENELVNLMKENDELLKEIREYEEKVKELTAQLQNAGQSQTLLSQKDNEIAQLKSTIAEKDNKINELQQEINNLNQKISELNQEIETLKQQAQAPAAAPTPTPTQPTPAFQEGQQLLGVGTTPRPQPRQQYQPVPEPIGVKTVPTTSTQPQQPAVTEETAVADTWKCPQCGSKRVIEEEDKSRILYMAAGRPIYGKKHRCLQCNAEWR